MSRRSVSLLTAAALSAGLTVSGCATDGTDAQQQAGGAVIGALVGCGVGALISGDARGCAAGAAVGAVTGWGAVAVSQYKARQVRSARADARLYGLSKPVDTAQVRIRSGSSSPKRIRPGQSVELATDYSVLLPSAASNARVEESWTLKKNGKVLASLPSKSVKRAQGGWVSEAAIDIPADAPAGTYVVEHGVKCGSSYDSSTSTFIVKS